MTSLVGYVLLFVVIGIGFIFVHLVAGMLIRPIKPDPDKMTIYECGEPTIGSAWVQFDLRYYVIALLFVIFDVEVAFFFPWAVVFGQYNTVANDMQTLENRVDALSALTPSHGDKDGKIQEMRESLKENTTESRQKVYNDLAESKKPAATLAWIAFWDILVFFAVLLVGYAYLWRRGDLAWIKTVTEKPAKQTATAQAPSGQLVGAGR